MQGDRPKAETLRDLLLEIRNGFPIYSPVLICVQDDPASIAESTLEHTVTVSEPLDWAEQYTREYANEPYVLVGSNTLQGGLDQPVTLGRSRRCDVRIENDSVSKVHASIVFDRGSGGYYIVDEESRNGTCINGERVAAGIRSSLWSGAYVSFGDAVYVFIDPPTLRKLSRLAN